MSQTGRFDTTTSTKIKTEYGTVLKVTTYEYDCTQPNVEYKARGICKFCGDKGDCYCFADDYFDHPLEEAIEYLRFGDICEKPECVIKYEERTDPERLKLLQAQYPDDPYVLRNAIWELWGEWDDGPIECGV